MRNLKEKFVEKAQNKFGNTFDYSKGEYKGSREKTLIICPKHGEIWMTPEGHLKSKTGCPRCSREQPKKAVIENTKRKNMREYNIWRAIKTRVLNKNYAKAQYYSEKGITCCDEWLNSFEQFYKDMGPCPENYTIDRINPDGNYCPENCRWASRKEQADNRGDFNKIFTYNGETHVLKNWARIFNIKYTTLYNRIYRSGKTFEEAIDADPFHRLLDIDGQKHTLKEWCELYNIEYNLVLNRVDKHKWDLKRALTTPKCK